jgi:pantoate kinase
MIHSGKKTLLDFLENPVIQEVPPGFKSIEQLANETGLSTSQARRLANDAVKDGTMERANIKTGKVYLNYYRVKKAKK